jgi:putative membrane protein
MEIFLTALVAGCSIYFSFRLLRCRQNNFDRRDSLDILKRRLASGEITVEEFGKLKEVL